MDSDEGSDLHDGQLSTATDSPQWSTQEEFATSSTASATFIDTDPDNDDQLLASGLEHISLGVFTASYPHMPPPTEPGLQSFHRFNDLPPEVRLIIWEMALPGKTTILQLVDQEDVTQRNYRRLAGGFPAVLQACHESRSAFTTVAGSNEDDKNKSGTQYELVKAPNDTGVYVNWHKDELLLLLNRGDDWGLGIIEENPHLRPAVAMFSNLMSLALLWDDPPFHPHPVWDDRCVAFVRLFPKLRTLTLIIDIANDEDLWRYYRTLQRMRWAKSKEVRRIAAGARAGFALEQERDPEWQPPKVRVQDSLTGQW